ncbi:TerB family tellurite resistance protein [Caenispirillum salinarum]|uniref:TerB family tellurite resistance protein n=1 Tax=Caenispirillum salinarum TaxID=859058 RepID=UPI00384E6F63
MSIWGKIIGGAAGLFMGGPLGALVGAAVGHAAYDRNQSSAEGEKEKSRLFHGDPLSGVKDRARQVAFTVAVVTLGAKMAKADGHVSRAEVDAFKRVFNIPPGDVATVGRLFDQAKQSAEGFEIYARQVAFLFKDSPQVLEELLGALFLIAQADGEVNAAELAFLEKVAQIFGLPPRAFERARATHRAGEGARARTTAFDDPYAVLGCARAAPTDEIKATHRRLLRENHPDVLVSQGLPQEFLEMAEDKMKAVNAAWDQIQRERGLK